MWCSVNMQCSVNLLNACRLGIVLAGVLHAHTCCAQGQASKEADEAAIRQAAKAYIAALQRGDAAAAAAAWTADGKFIDATGQTFRARDFVQKNVKPVKNGAESVDLADTHHSAIRFLTQNVAIEEGSLETSGDAETGGGTSSYSAIWVKQGDKWLLESVHESYVPSVHPLSALGWLIGDWTASTDELQVKCNAAWSDDDKFIVQKFSISRSGQEVQTGSQRIGWDPAAKVVRSWVFDSHGGFSEGTWRQEGDAWIVKTTGVLPDGSRSSGIHFWLPEGTDRIAVKHSHVEHNGVPVKDVTLELVREAHDK